MPTKANRSGSTAGPQSPAATARGSTAGREAPARGSTTGLQSPAATARSSSDGRPAAAATSLSAPAKRLLEELDDELEAVEGDETSEPDPLDLDLDAGPVGRSDDVTLDDGDDPLRPPGERTRGLPPLAEGEIGPRPTACEPEESPDLRRFDCGRYNDCLDHALHAGWASFGCHLCQAYAPPRPDTPEPSELTRLLVSRRKK
jgi:hypothetical protein